MCLWTCGPMLIYLIDPLRKSDEKFAIDFGERYQEHKKSDHAGLIQPLEYQISTIATLGQIKSDPKVRF